ncbi:MAG TPA: hypothetical protein PLZ51_29505, partial [Aggregatilineales bacterium]|nr:hypothetical protein [Aggregatilineales bacterium]
RDTLLNYDTLSAKLTATTIQAVIAEYDQFPQDEAMMLVRDALHLSAHIVTTHPDQLPNQLAGRLWFHRHKAEI